MTEPLIRASLVRRDPTYTFVAADEGKTMKAVCPLADDAGFDETLTSAATATVDAAPNNPATGAPSTQRDRSGGKDAHG